VYLDVSTSLDSWYPSATLGDHKTMWGGAGDGDTRWRMLNVTTDGPVRFGYATKADTTANFGGLSANSGFTYNGLGGPLLNNPNYQPNGPWYVVQAAGDRDEDGTLVRDLLGERDGVEDGLPRRGAESACPWERSSRCGLAGPRIARCRGRVPARTSN
jgi:hypothetical protein